MDNSETITVKYKTATWQLLLPDFFDAFPLKTVQRLVKYMLHDEDLNADAISTSKKVLEQMLVDAKKEWKEASIVFQREYRDPKFLTWKHEKAEAKRNNTEMWNAVKRTKAAHDRVLKIQAYFAPAA